jgi:hypothetical protein
MDSRESKLPKWAQDELRHLRARLEYARADIRRLTTGEDLPPSNFRINSDTGKPEWVRSFHARVRTYIGPTDRDWIELYQETQGSETYLVIYGDRQLSIQPSVSNVATVQLKAR